MALSYTSNYVRDINQKLSVSYKYGDGFPVLKELIQNADDAGASVLRIYVVDGIENAKTSLLRQPAIIVYNDGEFKQEHLKNILTMSVDSKTTDNSKIGRYGLGMKSIFHICDAFIFAICKKPDFLDIKIDCISPWEPNDPDHDYFNFPNDEERQLILQNLPFDLKKDNGFVLYLPIQEPGKPHVIQEHKISKDKPFGVIEDVLDNIGTTLPLLCEVSPSKSLKKVEYYINSKDCRSVFVDNRNQTIITESNGKKLKEEYCVYNAQVQDETLDKFKELTLNENWNQREEKKEIKPEITFELIRNNKEKKELFFKYCVYLPMEEPKIIPVKINTKNGFTILVHGNFAIDSGRRGFIGFNTLLNKQEDTVIEGTDSLQIMWNKVLAQEILFPEFPKFLEYCVDHGLLVFNKSNDEVSEFLNSFNSINFGTIPFINDYTCKNYCFGKVISFKRGKAETIWKSFDSSKDLIKLPEITDFEKIFEIFPTIENADCIYISYNSTQYQVIPLNYSPNSKVIEILINRLTTKALTDINLCKWFKTFIELNRKAFEESDSLITLLLTKIKQNLVNCTLSELSGNSKNLGELLSKINEITGNSYRKFFAVNIKDENCWKDIWKDNEELIFVPSFLSVDNNYIDDDYITNSQKSVCHYLESTKSIPSESHYDILQRILGKKRFDDMFQVIADQFETLSIFRIRDIKTNIDENATRAKLNSLVEKGLLFYFDSDFKETTPIKLYAKLINSLSIYSISKSAFFKDDRILSPNEEQDIFKSFQLQDYRNIEYDKKFLANFLEKMFDYSFKIDSSSADFYRFLFTNCNKQLKDETICFNNGNEVWKKIYQHINPNTFFIPDDFLEHTKRQISENELVLKIFPLDAEHCLDEMNKTFNLSFFREDEYFFNEEIQQTIFKEFENKHEELYNKIPLQYDSITKQFVAPKDKKCYLNSNRIKLPNGLNPNFYLIDPSNNDILASKQNLFLDKLEYKKAIETCIELGRKNNINVYEEVFSLLSHIDKWENFSDPSSCECALIEWIPIRGNNKYCSVQRVIDDSIFPETVKNYLTTNFDLYSKEQILLSEDKYSKLQSKKIIPSTYEAVFSYFIKPFSEKLYISYQFDTIEEFESCCYILRDFENVPVYGALYKLQNTCKNDNSRHQIFSLYKSLGVKCSVDKQIETLKSCLLYLNTLDITKTCEMLFEKTLDNLLEIGKDSFKISDYKYPVQSNTWKNAEEIAATDDLDYEPNYLLKKNIYEILDKKGLIKCERFESDKSSSNLENLVTSEDSIEIIRKTFAPWFECENLEHSKLLYMLFFLLQGNFSKYALDEKNITYFDCFTKEYELDTMDDNPKLWINNVPKSEVFTSFSHFKTVVHIPKGTTIPLSNLLGKKIPVPQINDDNPNTLWSERAWLSSSDFKSNVFHLELKKITNTVHELDRKLQELIESQVLGTAYRQFFNENGYKLFDAFLKTNQNTVKSTLLYIFDSLFDKLSSMGLKSNKDFKDLYVQYTELFSRQTSLDNEKFQSYEMNKKDDKQKQINDDKKRFQTELKNLILTNPEIQKDIHAAVKKQISKNQYSVSRILYELLQNADDAVCDISENPTFENRRRFSITVNKDTFIVNHYGRRINETPAGINHTDKYKYDLKNMLALNASDKDESDTGQFGLGFKSIYLASNEPILRSGELQFKIIGALYPQKLDYEEKLDEFETRIEFKLTEENITASDLLSEFSKTVAIQPLLCRGINQISICTEDDTCLIKTYCAKELTNIINSTSGKVSTVNLDGQNYLVIEGKNNLYKIIFKEHDGQIEIFKAASKEQMPRIWNLAPFAEYENLPFIINANFELDPGRTSLSKVDNKNKLLLDDIAESISQLLCMLYEGDSYSVGIFKSLLHVFLYTTKSPEKLFSDFAKRILKLISDEKHVIPTGKMDIISSTASICSVAANTFGLKPDDNEFIFVLTTIQNVFKDTKFVVSNVVRETFEAQWKQIDSYETLLLILSELHDYVLDNTCLESFLEIKKNTDHDENINWNIFKLINKDGIPKPVNTFTFSDSSSGSFEIINEEYSPAVIDFFSHQEFAKNNVILEKDNTIESQIKSIAELSSERDKLWKAIKTGNFDDLEFANNTFDNIGHNNLLHNLNETEYDPIRFEFDSYTPTKTIQQLYDEWHAKTEEERKSAAEMYYSNLLPDSVDYDNFVSPKEELTDADWFIIFLLAVYQSRPFCRDLNNKNFLNQLNALDKTGHLLEKLGSHKPSKDPQIWIDVILDFLDAKTYDQEYFDWFDEFPKMVEMAEFKDVYMQVLHDLNKLPEKNKHSILTPESLNEYSGTSVRKAPTIDRTVRIGFSLIIRELIRKGELLAEPKIEKFAFMPKSKCVKFVLGSGCNPSDTESEDLYRKIVKEIGPEKARFDGYYDIPLLLEVKPGERS